MGRLTEGRSRDHEPPRCSQPQPRTIDDAHLTIRRECVREDGTAVSEQERRAEARHDTCDQQPDTLVVGGAEASAQAGEDEGDVTELVQGGLREWKAGR